MNALTRRFACLVFGAGVTLVAGSGALADDTDIFIADADPTITGAEPNILFILDTSGSMGSQVVTQVDWDPDQTFNGCYDSDAIYGSLTGTPPPCGSNAYVWKSANRCEASLSQLAGIGQYQDNFQAWRQNGSRWVNLNANRKSRPFECEADRGIHGDGGTGTWAADGAAGPWSTDPGDEIAWNQDYTIFDGNWLNWNQSGGTVVSTRIQVVKDVSRQLLNNISDVNVGLMRFNRNANSGESGGPVIYAMSDVDTNREDMIDTIDALPASGFTPLSETMYEAGQYFAGRNVFYGNQVGNNLSVPASRVGGVITSDQYEKPVNFQCQKNYIVLLTDGAPTRDTDANGLIRSLPGFNTTVGADCDGNGQGRCLDDMADYLFNHDLDPNLQGMQNVTTYTVGFAIDLPASTGWPTTPAASRWR